MDNFLLFLVFYTMMLVVFGGMQYVVFQLYRRWFTYSFASPKTRKRFLWAGYGVLVVGNLLFYPRFIIPYTALHDSVFLQTFMVYPGGLYFAIIFMLFVFSTLFYAWRGVQNVISYFKFAFGSQEASEDNAETLSLPSEMEAMKEAAQAKASVPGAAESGISRLSG